MSADLLTNSSEVANTAEQFYELGKFVAMQTVVVFCFLSALISVPKRERIGTLTAAFRVALFLTAMALLFESFLNDLRT